MQHQSQHGQDAFVGDVLFRGRSGVFVDIGARDGRIISNTFYLEKQCGWTGIAVEPHPDLFTRLRDTRSCTCVNVAASDTVRADMAFVKFLEEPFGNSGLLATFQNPQRLEAIRHEIIAVPCLPVAKIASELKRIDYLDIDVEGHELDVLKGVDFAAVAVSIIGVEVAESSAGQAAIDAYLGDKGFRPFLQLASDRFYCQGPDVPSATRLQSLL